MTSLLKKLIKFEKYLIERYQIFGKRFSFRINNYIFYPQSRLFNIFLFRMFLATWVYLTFKLILRYSKNYYRIHFDQYNMGNNSLSSLIERISLGIKYENSILFLQSSKGLYFFISRICFHRSAGLM